MEQNNSIFKKVPMLIICIFLVQIFRIFLVELTFTVNASSFNNQVAAGGTSSYFVQNGKVRAWGGNSSGQLGIGNKINQWEAESIANLTNVKQLEVGISHTLALLENGTVKAWVLLLIHNDQQLTA